MHRRRLQQEDQQEENEQQQNNESRGVGESDAQVNSDNVGVHDDTGVGLSISEDIKDEERQQ